MDVGEVVGGEFGANVIQIDRLWVREIETSLNSRVEDYTVKLGKGFRNSENSVLVTDLCGGQ